MRSNKEIKEEVGKQKNVVVMHVHNDASGFISEFAGTLPHSSPASPSTEGATFFQIREYASIKKQIAAFKALHDEIGIDSAVVFETLHSDSTVTSTFIERIKTINPEIHIFTCSGILSEAADKFRTAMNLPPPIEFDGDNQNNIWWSNMRKYYGTNLPNYFALATGHEQPGLEAGFN